MEQDDDRAFGRPILRVADIEDAGVDLLQRAKRHCRCRLGDELRRCADWWSGSLSIGRLDPSELGRSEGDCADSEKSAPLRVNCLVVMKSVHGFTPTSHVLALRGNALKDLRSVRLVSAAFARRCNVEPA